MKGRVVGGTSGRGRGTGRSAGRLPRTTAPQIRTAANEPLGNGSDSRISGNL